MDVAQTKRTLHVGYQIWDTPFLGSPWLLKAEKTLGPTLKSAHPIGHFRDIKIQLDSEAERTKTIETRWNECEKYRYIIHFPLSLSSKSLFQAEFLSFMGMISGE